MRCHEIYLKLYMKSGSGGGDDGAGSGGARSVGFK